MPPQATTLPFTTVSDLVVHALDYLGGTSDQQANRDCLRCVLQSYREVTNARTWSYLSTHGRVLVNAPFQAGTIQYVHAGFTSGGVVYPRAVILSGSSWPANVGPGWQIRAGVVAGAVERQVSTTLLTLSEDVNFKQDLAAGTTYVAYDDEYLLPSDFIKTDTMIYEQNYGGLEFEEPTQALWWQRFNFTSGPPRFYSILGSRLFPGRLIVKYYPYPDQTKTVDFVYIRRPRDILIPTITAGTVSTVAGSTTVVGNGVAFPSGVNGCVLRTGSSSVLPGTWLDQTLPTWETVVYDWSNKTTLQASTPAPTTGTWMYRISDPIDVEPQSMMTAILRGVEKYLHVARNIQGKPDAFGQFAEALKLAMSDDSRSFQGKAMGDSGRMSRRQLVKRMPANFFP